MVKISVAFRLRIFFIGCNSVTIHHRMMLAHYKQMSDFERGRPMRLKKAGKMNRTIARQISQSHTVIRGC